MGTRRSVSRCAGDVVRNFFFSGAVTLSNSVGDSSKVAMHGLCEIRMVEGHTQTERGKRVACWSGFLLQGESSRLSDMSNHLSCGYHLVVN
jgi:hypothetical protein